MQASRSPRSSYKCLWGNVAHCCEHGDPSVLQLCLTTSLEVLNAAVRSKSCGIPESHQLLHTQLVLKGKPGRSLLNGKVTPWAARHTILHPCNQQRPSKRNCCQQCQIRYRKSMLYSIDQPVFSFLLCHVQECRYKSSYLCLVSRANIYLTM